MKKAHHKNIFIPPTNKQIKVTTIEATFERIYAPDHMLNHIPRAQGENNHIKPLCLEIFHGL